MLTSQTSCLGSDSSLVADQHRSPLAPVMCAVGTGSGKLRPVSALLKPLLARPLLSLLSCTNGLG